MLEIENSNPRRLRRLETVWTNRGRPLFFVTFCTADRQGWLRCHEVHDAFRSFCAKSPQQAEVWIGKYVLMPDHVHVFISAEGSQSLSKWVAAMKGVLASVRRKMGIDGRAWQTGFFDHVLRGAESYAEKWNYVQKNPVRARLVASAEEWPYAGEIEVLSW
jgi:putative transposase